MSEIRWGAVAPEHLKVGQLSASTSEANNGRYVGDC